MTKIFRLASIALLAAIALSSCGNKGPLVVPDKTPAQSQDSGKR